MVLSELRSRPGLRSVSWVHMSFLVWLIRTAGTVERGVSSEHLAAADGGHHGRSEFSSAAEKGRRTSQQACNDDTLRRDDSGDNANDEAVAAYQMSVQAGNPLSERKLAQLFGRTSRRWARARITDARQAAPLPDSPVTPITAWPHAPAASRRAAPQAYPAVLHRSLFVALTRPPRGSPALS